MATFLWLMHFLTETPNFVQKLRAILLNKQVKILAIHTSKTMTRILITAMILQCKCLYEQSNL